MADTNDVKKVTKTEKKTRDAMSKLGLAPVNDIFRVTLKQKEGVLIVVAEPEVYASPSGEVFVVFGETSFDDIGSRMQRAAAQAPRPQVDEIVKAALPTTVVEEKEEEIVAQVVSDVDYQGVDPKDVEIVMKETGASREKVIETLKVDGDIVTAVLSLSQN